MKGSIPKAFAHVQISDSLYSCARDEIKGHLSGIVAFFSYYVGSGDQNQAVSLATSTFYLLSLLANMILNVLSSNHWLKNLNEIPRLLLGT